MKHIKIFEQNIADTSRFIDKYWRIDLNSQDELIVALEKLGLTPKDNVYQDILDYFTEFDTHSAFYFNCFYIMKGVSMYGEDYWYYSVDLSHFKGRCQYMGKVKVEDYEVKAWKYNL